MEFTKIITLDKIYQNNYLNNLLNLPFCIFMYPSMLGQVFTFSKPFVADVTDKGFSENSSTLDGSVDLALNDGRRLTQRIPFSLHHGLGDCSGHLENLKIRKRIISTLKRKLRANRVNKIIIC